MLDNGSSVPFYEYRRQDGTTFEIMQKMVDPPLECDPETGLPVTRVFHPIAVHFKGKGFYNTDYGTKKRAREKDAHDSSKKKSEKSDVGGRRRQGRDEERALDEVRAGLVLVVRLVVVEFSTPSPKPAKS